MVKVWRKYHFLYRKATNTHSVASQKWAGIWCLLENQDFTYPYEPAAQASQPVSYLNWLQCSRIITQVQTCEDAWENIWEHLGLSRSVRGSLRNIFERQAYTFVCEKMTIPDCIHKDSALCNSDLNLYTRDRKTKNSNGLIDRTITVQITSKAPKLLSVDKWQRQTVHDMNAMGFTYPWPLPICPNMKLKYFATTRTRLHQLCLYEPPVNSFPKF